VATHEQQAQGIVTNFVSDTNGYGGVETVCSRCVIWRVLSEQPCAGWPAGPSLRVVPATRVIHADGFGRHSAHGPR